MAPPADLAMDPCGSVQVHSCPTNIELQAGSLQLQTVIFCG